MMDDYQTEITKIQKILNENPKGMTVTDIARKIKINRNSVAKYLDIMRISGLVEMITFGPAKVFFPSKRVPINQMLNYVSDFVIVIDQKLKVTMINRSLLGFIDMRRDEIIGNSINYILSNIFEEDGIIDDLNEALEGQRVNREISFTKNGKEFYVKIRVLPTSFEDGDNGATLIINNLTAQKIVENALRESEKNFKKLIDKIK